MPEHNVPESTSLRQVFLRSSFLFEGMSLGIERETVMMSWSLWPLLLFSTQQLSFIKMNSRASVIRIFRSSQISKHVASNRISLWSFSHCRLTPLGNSWSIANCTLSTTNARKPDLAGVVVSQKDKDPSERFRTHLAEGTLTRPLAVSCLQDAVLLNQPHSQLGKAAMMWLWNQYDTIRYPDDVDLTDSLAILLVREGKEEMMWEWIAQESQSHNIPTKNGRILKKRCDWCNAAFRGLVEAKAHLATDNSLDAALETFFRGTRVPYLLPMQSAANFCHKMLCRPTHEDPKRTYEEMRSSLRFPNTDLTLWNAFYVWSAHSPKYFAALYQARLKLFHPQQQDPWPLYSWWQDVEHNQNHPLRQVQSQKNMVSKPVG
ncbi:hypothetical protein KCV03_g207, partial [Aureobasidium melanogenum]